MRVHKGNQEDNRKIRKSIFRFDMHKLLLLIRNLSPKCYPSLNRINGSHPGQCCTAQIRKGFAQNVPETGHVRLQVCNMSGCSFWYTIDTHVENISIIVSYLTIRVSPFVFWFPVILTSFHFFTFWMKFLWILLDRLHHRILHTTSHPCRGRGHEFVTLFEFWRSGKEL